MALDDRLPARSERGMACDPHHVAPDGRIVHDGKRVESPVALEAKDPYRVGELCPVQPDIWEHCKSLDRGDRRMRPVVLDHPGQRGSIPGERRGECEVYLASTRVY